MAQAEGNYSGVSRMERWRVVVIGGGAVGCSCLYHLALRGWTSLLLLEQSELTSGSTWHAAGNVPTFATSWGVLKLQQYSAALYRQLGEAVQYPINYHVTGSVRLAHTQQRMDEYRHVLGMARANGLAYEILEPVQLRDRHPFVQTEDLKGALWDPVDGDIDPAQLTQALAAGARARGAVVRRHTRVTGLARRHTGEWLVTTDQGSLIADIVVNAAGYRAGEVMALLGQQFPIVTLSHQYLVTDDIPDLLAREQRVPLLRDPDISYYLRQERGGFILGPYEQQATAMWLDGIPDDFSYKLWDDDLQRVESYIEAAFGRVPLLAGAGIKRVVNGPIPYSPDGLPYVGPAHGLSQFFHCNTFSFGIAQAGGAGKALAEWVIDGGPQWDLWMLDPRRFTDYATRTYTLAKAVETYQQEYAPAFPFEERPAGRPLRMSPLHERLAMHGAAFGARGGWERALWFDAASSQQPLTFRRTQPWRAPVGAEVQAVRHSVGIMDLPGFTRIAIEGPGAEAYVDRLICTRLPREGRVALTYALNPRGQIVSEFTLTRLSPDKFLAMSAASAEHHDDDLFTQALPSDGSVRLDRLTERTGVVILAGPRSRDVLARMTRADVSNNVFPWLAARTIEIGSARVLALRVSYTGELGWELHTPVADIITVYEAALQAGASFGIRHFGLYALDSLRIDKCYRSWKTDIDCSSSPLEASLERFVDFTKHDFIGREALLAERARTPTRRLMPLVLDAPGTADAPSSSSVFFRDENIGVTTSGVWSYTLDRSIALAYLRSDIAQGTRVTIEILGEPCAAVVGREPLYDPDNSRLRS